ncbi:transcriptional regulator, GntR family [Pseudonocardia ammonioxydans]|uniref:Transcriptional regulator, GntR family n=1 Tax=Pseudonocardia ammonioxydans TaxID=260086 RepID=A0A1I5HPD2_PSUAM|nr:FadR/GntR family transcriptional regulator [Pseudonocardia ammonioxydans]SFO50175.1 transcriptional regulator, GntR family [Pseudonocardia ammonioxydans]
MQPVRPAERRHETVARLLREEILRGTYRPGERLPIERELSRHFDVSRSVIRQALLILDQQGLVRVRSGVGGGPFVAQDTMPAALAAFENTLAVDPSSVAEFAWAKCILEPAINAVAAETISDEQIAALETNVEASRAALERGESAVDHLIDFHSILVNSTRNRFLAIIVELMSRSMDRLTGTAGIRHLDGAHVLEEHEAIMDALRRRDADEVRALSRDHLTGIWREELGTD